MTSRKEWFINYSLFRTLISIGLGNNSIIKAVGSGPVRISMTVDRISRLFELQDVYYIQIWEQTICCQSLTWSRRDTLSTLGQTCARSQKLDQLLEKLKIGKDWVLDGNPVVPDPYVAYVAKASLSIWHK